MDELSADSEKGLCLLSLDGGGVRGLSTLYILRTLMIQLNAARAKAGMQGQVKPCQIFDMIGGTSTGGLIAIMLGRLEMDVDQCIAAYKELMKDVFAERKNRSRVNWFSVTQFSNLQPQFDSQKLEEAVKRVITDQGVEADALFNDGTEPKCRVMVCAASKSLGGITILRSYDNLKSGIAVNATICEAALATSAATGFFSEVTIDGRKFVDGALGANNPVERVEVDALDVWASDDGDLMSRVKCFVSIGTGHPGLKAMKDSALGFLSETLVSIATDTEEKAKAFLSRWQKPYDHGRYFRFNVQHGLENVGLEEYKQEGEMMEATDRYLNDHTYHSRVRACVNSLAHKECVYTLDETFA